MRDQLLDRFGSQAVRYTGSPILAAIVLHIQGAAGAGTPETRLRIGVGRGEKAQHLFSCQVSPLGT